jgi:uncharacterized protein YjdB
MSSEGFVTGNGHVRDLILFITLTCLTLSGCVRPEPPQQEVEILQAEPLTEPQKELPPPSPPPVAKIELRMEQGSQAILVTSDSKQSMEIGETKTFKAVAFDLNQQRREDVTITWISENQNVATIDPLGTLTALAPGQTTITAFGDGQSAAVKINVLPPKIAKLEIVALVTTLAIGETLKLDWIATDTRNQVHKNKPAIWKSDNVQVAQINDKGLVTALKAGNATLSATVDNKTASVKMKVIAPQIARLEIRPSQAQVQVNGFQKFRAVLIDEKNQVRNVRVSWKTDRPQTAYITDDGTLYALETGTVVITAAAGEKKASVKVSIVEPPPSPPSP